MIILKSIILMTQQKLLLLTISEIKNVVVYGLLRGLARNLANKNRIENPRGFSKVCLH